ncbi:MAG: branched chain amino acid aminotransferase [Candidatus Aenigmarchaeota archaeon ex4484_52]|nr:MAG: branched chain amino acid aminotransferase [Candidatus Aenigmarchaeota archaeon ex4484_52]
MVSALEAVKQEKIWMNGKLINWGDAKVHVLSHALHYGTSVFEGIRCYNTKNGSGIFRLKEHINRLFDSAKIYRLRDIDFSREEVINACKEVIKANKLKSAYVRPIIFKGYGGLAVIGKDSKTQLSIAAWPWGKYLGESEKGLNVKVSSWTKLAPNTMPPMAKAGSNYMNAQLAVMEVTADGYDEAILLDKDGFVSEGSGENIFLVKDNIIYTPSITSSILDGITRKSVLEIAQNLKYKTKQEKIPREMLYIADELFFTGTAAEILPITYVDKIKIADGKIGPVTQKIKNEFYKCIETGEPKKWFEFV